MFKSDNIVFNYRVINSKTGEDMTEDRDWVIRPDGSLYYLDYCDLIGHPDARVVLLSVDLARDIPQ